MSDLVVSRILDSGTITMSLRLLRAAAETENTDDFHLVRLLILLRGADLRKRKPEGKGKAIDAMLA